MEKIPHLVLLLTGIEHNCKIGEVENGQTTEEEIHNANPQASRLQKDKMVNSKLTEAPM